MPDPLEPDVSHWPYGPVKPWHHDGGVGCGGQVGLAQRCAVRRDIGRRGTARRTEADGLYYQLLHLRRVGGGHVHHADELAVLTRDRPGHVGRRCRGDNLGDRPRRTQRADLVDEPLDLGTTLLKGPVEVNVLREQAARGECVVPGPDEGLRASSRARTVSSHRTTVCAGRWRALSSRSTPSRVRVTGSPRWLLVSTTIPVA